MLHGTTVATNAVLEHRGARTGMVTTEGMRDVVHIGRHQRPQPYSVMQDIPWQTRPFVERAPPRPGRRAASSRRPARRSTALDEDAVRAAGRQLRDAGVEAIAVCFLFSYLDPSPRGARRGDPARGGAGLLRHHEREHLAAVPRVRALHDRVHERVRRPGDRPLPRAPDRRAQRAEGVDADLLVMRSNGGVASVAEAAERPVTLMLSGPAAGVLGAQWAGALVGRANG